MFMDEVKKTFYDSSKRHCDEATSPLRLAMTTEIRWLKIGGFCG